MGGLKMATEKRLIDANALLELVQFRLPIDNHNAEVISGCVDITRRLIQNAPTVDAVEVVHGRWVDEFEGKYANPKYICSNCTLQALKKEKMDVLGNWHTEQALTDYCPNCGAKMDGDKNE